MARMLSIMPTVDGVRSPKYHHVVDVSDDVPDEAVGEAVGDCLRRMQKDGAFIGDNLIELNLRFA